MLMQSVVFLEKHRVKICSVCFSFRELFNTKNPFNTHILSNFDCIGTPRRNHGSTRTYEKFVEFFFFDFSGVTEEPAKFCDCFRSKFSYSLNRINRLVLIFKKVNHCVVVLKVAKLLLLVIKSKVIKSKV